MIELSSISFAYGNKEVLKDISLNIRKGEIVGILGPNGAGKSTLIKLMSGVLSSRLGNILIDNKAINKISARERARLVALVPQENSIPFSFSAMEVVLMGRTPHLNLLGFESARDIEIARNSMVKTDCLEFTARDINSLSGGERQRVILARALAQEAEVLFLDEPTTFLDIKHQIGLHTILREENKGKGTTIICALHDLNIASVFCDRIILLKEGKIVADGIPQEVITTEIINQTFGVSVHISTDSATGVRYCLAMQTVT